jgi:hypothetical protein
MATGAKFQYNAFAIKPQQPGPPDFPREMAATSRDADRVATPRGVADSLLCGIADDVPPSTASKRSMALNRE